MSSKRRLPEASARQLDSLDAHVEAAIETLEAAIKVIQKNPRHCESQINHAKFLLMKALRHSDRARRNED